MEGIFLVLIGAALYSQAWYVLGLYSEGRTMGVLVGGLGLLALATITFTPVLLTGTGAGADMLAETTVMKVVIVAWALYAVAVATHGLWDFDERAIGFYGGFLAVASLVAAIYFAAELEQPYSNGAWLGLSGATILLTVMAAIMFFYQALQFSVLRLVAGWFLLLGGVLVGVVGLAVVGTVIS